MATIAVLLTTRTFECSHSSRSSALNCNIRETFQVGPALTKKRLSTRAEKMVLSVSCPEGCYALWIQLLRDLDNRIALQNAGEARNGGLGKFPTWWRTGWWSAWLAGRPAQHRQSIQRLDSCALFRIML